MVPPRISKVPGRNSTFHTSFSSPLKQSTPAGPGSKFGSRRLPRFGFILSEIRSSYAFMTVEEMPLPSALAICAVGYLRAKLLSLAMSSLLHLRWRGMWFSPGLKPKKIGKVPNRECDSPFRRIHAHIPKRKRPGRFPDAGPPPRAPPFRCIPAGPGSRFDSE